MKNLKSKIRDFLDSEEGRVGVKTPLALGVAAGGLMLAQAFVVTPQADACTQADDCAGNETCMEKCLDWVWVAEEEYWTCRVWGMGCVEV
ncbi:MAG: hypothetical protein OXN25_22390 [Candidatus Poribacteria bacterium]|nr:hypothetical protein [Candidatus Poribacteria bacterium]